MRYGPVSRYVVHYYQGIRGRDLVTERVERVWATDPRDASAQVSADHLLSCEGRVTSVEHACATCGDPLEDCICGVCRECDGEIGDYGASDRDEKIAQSAGMCEDCHERAVRLVERNKRDAIRFGRGDYLRDQQR